MTVDRLPVSIESRLRMRIVLAINALTLGGAETQLVRLALALVEDGHEVRVMTMQPSNHFLDTLSDLRIPMHQVTLVRRAAALSSIASATRLLAKWRPDVLISFLYQANMLSRLAGRLARVPVVISSVRNEFFGGRARELSMRLTDRLACATVVNSTNAAKALVDRGVISSDRVRVVPNGLNVGTLLRSDAIRSDTRRSLGITDEEFVWLGAGRLTTQKDWPTLLRAAAQMPTTSAARVLVAGQGPLREELVRLAREVGVQERVNFLGPRDDIPDLLAAADGLVLSSSYEGLPNIILEAMAAARPVVATSVGGVTELVSSATGRVVPAGDSDRLAQAMCEVAALPDQGRSLGRAAREVISERYALDRVMREWIDLIGGLHRTAHNRVRP